MAERVAALAAHAPPERLLRCIEAVLECREALAINVKPKFAVDAMVATIGQELRDLGGAGRPAARHRQGAAGRPLGGGGAAGRRGRRPDGLRRGRVRAGPEPGSTHHLLLAEVATSRDLEDPATVAFVAERIPDVEMLDLLEVLTEADARGP